VVSQQLFAINAIDFIDDVAIHFTLKEDFAVNLIIY